MEICTICNKTYKNIQTLKTHYNSNAHKRQAELVTAAALTNQQQVQRTTQAQRQVQRTAQAQQQVQRTAQAQQQVQRTAQAQQQVQRTTQAQQQVQRTTQAQQQVQRTTQAQVQLPVQRAKTKELEKELIPEGISQNPLIQKLLHARKKVAAEEELNDEEDEYDFGCMTCKALFSTKHELTVHQYNCPDFVLGVMLSYASGVHLGICLKTIFTDKFYKSTTDKVLYKLKVYELESFGSSLDVDMRKSLSEHEPEVDSQSEHKDAVDSQSEHKDAVDSQLDPTVSLKPGEEASWINFRAIRPIHEENMIMLREPENIAKLMASGSDCFKTILDIVYSRPENQNMYFSDINGMISVTVSVDGEILIIKTVEIIPVLIQKYIDYLINLFTTLGQPIEQIYDNIGIKVITTGHEVKLVNDRLGDHTKFMCDAIQSFKQRAIKNINLFNKVKHILLEADKKLLNFCKYTIFHSNTIYTYKNATEPATS